MKQIIMIQYSNIKNACYLAVLTVFAAVMLFSCTTTRPTCIVPVPPKIRIVSPIAVLEFKGPQPYARELAGNIEAMIVNSKWQGENTYNVVDRNHINKVIRELKFANSSWLADPKHAARAGKLMGARTVIVGEVVRAKTNDTPYTEQKKTCLKWKEGASNLEIILGTGCARHQINYIPCVKRKGHFSFSYKVIDVQTSRIVYAQKIGKQSKETKQCNPNRPMRGDASTGGKTGDILRSVFSNNNLGNIQSETDAITEAMVKAVNTIKPDLSAHLVKVSVKTTSPVTGISKSLSQGSQYISGKAQLWDKACPIWEAAYQQNPSAYELAYNLGLCAEANGKFKEAMYYYQEAYTNMNGIDQDVINARERLKNYISK